MAYPVIDRAVDDRAVPGGARPAPGDRLDPALGRRIRYEVDRRCLVPYLQRHDHPWLFDSPDRPVNNWSAVCNAGVAGAAIHLEPDAARLAEILARAARSLDDYLSTFDEDRRSTKDRHTGLTGSATTPYSPTSWDTARAGEWTSSTTSI